MPESEPGPPLANCRQCAEPIATAARLCRHCHSYQDWRGNMAVSSNVLALILALVSLLSLTLPGAVNLIRREDSAVELSHPVLRGDILYLMAANTGERPGVIEHGRIKGEAFRSAMATIEPVSAADAFIKPGAQQLRFRIRVKLSALDARLRALTAATKRDRRDYAGVAISIRQARGGVRTKSFDLSAADVFDILEAHSERCEALTDKPSTANGCKGLDDIIRENDEHARRVIESLGGPSRKSGRPRP